MLEPQAPRALLNQAGPMPDPEVRERPVRRRFTAEYKRQQTLPIGGKPRG